MTEGYEIMWGACEHLEKTGPEVFAHGDVDEGVDDGMDKV